MINYCKILGIENGASQEEIQTAFERLSKELDPKNNDNQEFFVEEYIKVQEAYKALSNSSILGLKTAKKMIESIKNSDESNNFKFFRGPFLGKFVRLNEKARENIISKRLEERYTKEEIINIKKKIEEDKL